MHGRKCNLADEKQPKLATFFNNREISRDEEASSENKDLLKSMFYSKWHFINYTVKNVNIEPGKYRQNQDQIYKKDISSREGPVTEAKNASMLSQSLLESIFDQSNNKSNEEEEIDFLKWVCNKFVSSLALNLYVLKSRDNSSGLQGKHVFAANQKLLVQRSARPRGADSDPQEEPGRKGRLGRRTVETEARGGLTRLAKASSANCTRRISVSKKARPP